MSTKYSISTNQLEFSTDYKSLIVKDGSGVTIGTYALDNGSDCALLSLSSTDYELSTVSLSVSPKVHIDVAQDPDMVFDGDRLGGTLIIDLRDIGRSNSSSGCQEMTFLLDECDFRFWYDGSSGYALKLHFADNSACENSAC